MRERSRNKVYRGKKRKVRRGEKKWEEEGILNEMYRCLGHRMEED